jgi:hypothetical protein
VAAGAAGAAVADVAVAAGAVVGAGIAVGAGVAAGAHAPSNMLTPIKIDKTAINRFIFNLLLYYGVLL